jgi:hypothetical protein
LKGVEQMGRERVIRGGAEDAPPQAPAVPPGFAEFNPDDDSNDAALRPHRLDQVVGQR